MTLARSPKTVASSSSRAPWGLHWFRRDLRVAGNPALRWSQREHGGRVLGVFCFDAKFLGRPDFSADRFAFFLATLAALRDDLRAAGGDLLVLDEGPAPAFERLVAALDARHLARPATVSWNRDYEPFARARDAAMTEQLGRAGVAVHTACDHLVVEPDELRKPEARGGAPTFYQVYTPFARRWFELLATSRVEARLDEQRAGLADLERPPRAGRPPFTLTWPALFGGAPPLADHLERFTAANARRVQVPIPRAGARAALERLRAFAPRLPDYKSRRDLPAEDGTSRLSMFFKNGSLTPAQAIVGLGLPGAAFGAGTGPSTFLRELAWREFYYHVLWHRPDVEGRAFLPGARRLEWEDREDWFDAWRAGRTGYPIVDAGMRQLAATGWMHNRVRMIVASFLTKDLLIDWRRGERWFMERLLDGDLAPNNGGWQWAASTGCDAQPYFRVFNPVLQGRRFDPTGAYVRAWVPERRGDSAAEVHEPRGPIVDHATQKARALALFRAAAP
ncbi:MAG TPA: deoxyribodipyrimidine photo-lyase [Polyangia bacterium]|nr:deoxyribodipyrimidine photo-lyase [Polyangia bacterium]